MTEYNKAILERANAAISRGDHEGFLEHCTEDTQWKFIGDITLEGKEAVRSWMTVTYAEPPQFIVSDLIAERDFVTAIGTIALKNKEGKLTSYAYCDVWRFHKGKMAELRAFVVEIKPAEANRNESSSNRS